MNTQFKLPSSWFARTSAGQPTIGTWMTLPDPSIAEILSASGFDWIVIDNEHSPLAQGQIEELIRVISLYELPVLVRVGANDSLLIKYAMDSGASGVIVPMVNNSQDAVNAVNAVKYPPNGERGVGLARAQGFGIRFEHYKEWVQASSTVIVQIEHIEAIENLEEIVSVKGVDGFIVGPYDLSASLAKPGDFNNDGFLLAMKKVGRILESSRKPGGFHVVYPDVGRSKALLAEGYSFLALGVDFIFLGEMCRRSVDSLRDSIRDLQP